MHVIAALEAALQQIADNRKLQSPKPCFLPAAYQMCTRPMPHARPKLITPCISTREVAFPSTTQEEAPFGSHLDKSFTIPKSLRDVSAKYIEAINDFRSPWNCHSRSWQKYKQNKPPTPTPLPQVAPRPTPAPKPVATGTQAPIPGTCPPHLEGGTYRGVSYLCTYPSK